jgi:hypothetical protein
MSMLELNQLRETPLVSEPFEHLVVPRFVKAECLEAIGRDFPPIASGGSFPLKSLRYGPAFQRLTDELLGDELRHILAVKFDMDLSERPATLTVRGRTRPKDGQIHIDSKTKLITVLLYLNRHWTAEGGRLRLLRSEHDLEDVVAEVPPDEGSLVAFRCRENAWHGHHPFDGERRSLQLNYVVSQSASRWSSLRHSMSAMLKSLRAG